MQRSLCTDPTSPVPSLVRRQAGRRTGRAIALACLLPRAACAAALFASLTAPLLADTQAVYRSVDENGVVSFSDQPPETGPAQVIRIDAPPVAEDPDLNVRLEAMRETTDRMASDRRERELHRADLRAARAKTEPAAPVADQAPPWNGAFWPAYRPLRPRPPRWPHPPLRPHPQHPPLGPAQRPGAVPPGWSVMQPGNAQLMRPVVSSRR